MSNQKNGLAARGRSNFQTGIQGPSAAPNSIVGYIWYFMVQVFSSVPFSVRTFLRNDIGSLTFSWINIVFAALWVRFVLDGTYSITEFAPPDIILIDSLNKSSALYYLALPFWYIGMFFAQFARVITEFIPKEKGLGEVLPFLLSCGVLLLGIAQKYNTKLKHDRRQAFDPLSFGKSNYFEFILNELNPKNRERTLFWIEFGVLITISYGCYLWSLSEARLINYCGFFAAGALGLLLEDQYKLFQKRREIEYRLANEYRAVDLQSTYEEYTQVGGAQGMATVSYAGRIGLYQPTSVMPSPSWQTGSPYGGRGRSSNNVNTFVRKYAWYLVFLLIPLAIWMFWDRAVTIDHVGIVKTELLTLRKKPKRDAATITTLPSGTVLQIAKTNIEDRDGRKWCKIKYNDGFGYAVEQGAEGKQYLWTSLLDQQSLSDHEFPFEDRVMTDHGSPLNLREEPSLDAEVVTSMPNSSELVVLSVAGDPIFLEVGSQLLFGNWCRVEFDGQEGYCFSWFLERSRIPYDPYYFLELE